MNKTHLNAALVVSLFVFWVMPLALAIILVNEMVLCKDRSFRTKKVWALVVFSVAASIPFYFAVLTENPYALATHSGISIIYTAGVLAFLLFQFIRKRKFQRSQSFH